MSEGGIDSAPQAPTAAVRTNLEALHDRLQAEAPQPQQGQSAVKDWVSFIHRDVTPIISPLTAPDAQRVRLALLGRSQNEEGERLALGFDINTGKLLMHRSREGSENETSTTEIGDDPALLDNLPEHDRSFLQAVASWGKDRAVRAIARAVTGEPDSKVVNGWRIDDPPLK